MSASPVRHLILITSIPAIAGLFGAGLLGAVYGVPMTLAYLVIAAAAPLVATTPLLRQASGTTPVNATALDIFVALTVLAEVLAISIFFRSGEVSHDVAWYLVATSKWLDGAKLYQDVVEVNPPLNFYWTLPMVVLSRWSGLGLQTSFLTVLGVVSGFSLFWVWRILAHISEFSNSQRYVLVQLSAFAIFWFTWGQPGQREHILTICILPFLFTLVSEHSGVRVPTSQRVAVASFAVLGIALKPHFVVIPIFVAVSEAMRTRSIRPIFKVEYWILVLGCLLYIAYTKYTHPLYFSDVIPMALVAYSKGYNASLNDLLNNLPIIIFLSPLFVLLLALRLGVRLKGLTVLLAASLGGGLSYYLQFKGFAYHIFPFFIFGFLFLASIIVTHKTSYLLKVACAVGVAVLLAIGTPRSLYTQSDKSADFRTFTHKIVPGSDVLVLSTYLSASFPTFLDPRYNWVSRFPAQWLLPGSLGGLADTDCRIDVERCEKLAFIVDFTRRADIEDLTASDADIVAFDTDHFRLDNFQFLAFLSEDPAFADIWANYEFIGRTRYFEFWRRKR